MTFKHKLARRLAGLPRIGLGVFMVAALSCGDGSLKQEGLAPPPPPPSPAQLLLTQDSDSLLFGATAHFSVYGVTSAGDSVNVAVTWSATGGSIAADGTYIAGGTAGTFQVAAQHASGISASTSVTRGFPSDQVR